MKSNIIKFRLEQQDDGQLKITPFSNKQVPFAILSEINKVVQDKIAELNGAIPSKNKYVHFEHNGKAYRQVDKEPNTQICEGCVFLSRQYVGIDPVTKKLKLGISNCMHPHLKTKGDCEGKIYVIETK